MIDKPHKRDGNVIQLDRRAATEAEYYRPFDEEVNRRIAAMLPTWVAIKCERARWWPRPSTYKRRPCLRRPARPRRRKCEHEGQLALLDERELKPCR